MAILRSYRKTSLALIASVLLFNAGIPVSVYLCPMMSDENPWCDMSVPSFGDIPSITRQASGCCAKVILAERNSTPYLKLDERLETALAPSVLAAEDAREVLEGFTAPLAPRDTGPPETPAPLYILHSTLLI